MIRSFFLAFYFYALDNRPMRLNPFAMNANLMKRTGAAVLDLFLWIIGSFLLLSYVFGPLYDLEFGTSQLSNQFVAYQEASYLYRTDEETDQLVNLDLEDVPDALFNYYSIFKDEKVFETGEPAFAFTTSWFNTTVLKVDESDAIFELVNGDTNVVAVLKDGVDDLDRDAFYTDAYRNALIDFNTYPPFNSLVALINRYFLEIIGYSALISFILFYLAIPLGFKQGQTLGKMASRLVVVNDKGYAMKWWQLPIRSVVFAITLYTAIFTIFGTILLSYTLMVFTKFFRSGNDFVASTRIIDKKNSVVFLDEQGLRAYEYQLETGKVFAEDKR